MELCTGRDFSHISKIKSSRYSVTYCQASLHFCMQLLSVVTLTDSHSFTCTCCSCYQTYTHKCFLSWFVTFLKGSSEEFCQHNKSLLLVIYFSIFLLSLRESLAVFSQGPCSFSPAPMTTSLSKYLLYSLPKASNSNCSFWKSFFLLPAVGSCSQFILHEIRYALSSPITHSSNSTCIA